MKKILLLILITAKTSVFAQVFAPIGSIWHYTQRNPFQYQGWTYETIESVSDTIIGEIQCKKLIEIKRLFGDTLSVTNRYMYSENDSIYFFEDSAFHLLYDFGAETGDTIVLNYFLTFDGSPLKMIIDSTDSININGIHKKIQYITCGDGVIVEFGDQVIESIGSTYFMFPVYDGMIDGHLRCYQDSIMGLYLSQFHPNYGWNYIDCAEIITIIEDMGDGNDPIIYPNPTYNYVIIEDINLPIRFRIIDMYGRVMKTGKLINKDRIDLSDIVNGVYLIVLTKENNLYKTFWEKGFPIMIIN